MKREMMEKAAYENPSSNIFSKTTEEVCKMLLSGKMSYSFPVFDGGWSKEHIVAFLNNMIFGSTPISPVAINIESQQPFYDDIPDIAPDISEGIPAIAVAVVSKYIVIDGRQRLSVLLKVYTNDPDYARIVLDLPTCRFKEVLVVEEMQIPIGVLCNQDFSVFFNYVSGKFDQHVKLINAIRNKFLGYSINMMYANNLFRDQQLSWFTVLNNAGSTMTEADMLLFKLDNKDKELRPYDTYIRPYNDMLSNYGLDYLLSSSRAKTSYPLTALNPLIERMFSGGGRKNNYTPIPSDVKIGILDSILPGDLRQMFADSLEALEWTLEFFKAKGIMPSRMEYVTYISGFYILRHPTAGSYDMLEQWYRNTLFTDASNTEKRQIYSRLLSMEVL